MRSLPSRLVFAATAATSLSLALAAQDAIVVSGTHALVRTNGVTSSFSRDGGSSWIALPDNNHRLNWRDRSFDPLAGDPGVPPALLADGSNKLFYVQYVTDIIPEYADAMRRVLPVYDHGIEVLLSDAGKLTSAELEHVFRLPAARRAIRSARVDSDDIDLVIAPTRASLETFFVRSIPLPTM